MHISSNFDSGNIEVISIEDIRNIRLNIRKDTKADYFQWFHFRVHDVKGYPCKYVIENANEASYPEGWDNYKVCVSYDRINWFRLETQFNGKELTFEHTSEFNSVFYAYFTPYSYEQHLDLIHAAQISPLCVIENIGLTVEQRNMDLLIVGNPGESKKKIWIIARQHPGESMASWFIEGFIERILDEEDPVSRKILQDAVFYIMPFVNPDGAISGNLRANAAGINLNREWANPDISKSPEAYYILKKMDETGVDLMLDIHGDEGLPYNFVSSIEGIPGYDSRLKDLLETFKKVWLDTCPDFQDEHTYPVNDPGTANLNICSKQIGHKFNCLSITVEMPFKDNNDLPDPVYGWSSERSLKFGGSILQPILSVLKKL